MLFVVVCLLLGSLVGYFFMLGAHGDMHYITKPFFVDWGYTVKYNIA